MSIYSIPPILTLCGFLGLIGLTIKHGRWEKADLLFFVVCLLGSFLYIDYIFAFNVGSADTALFISRLGHLFIVYISASYLHFFHAYLKIEKRKWIIPICYGYAFVLMWFTQSTLYIESVKKHDFGFFPKGGALYPFFAIMSLFVTIYVVLLLYRAIICEKKGMRKNKLKYMLAGFGIMGLLNALNVLPILGFSIYPPGNFSFIPMVIFGFGLFKHDLLDTGILIRKGLIYSILTSFLTGGYALIIIAADNLLSEYDFAGSIYFSICFFFFIAIIFGPVKTKIQVLVDRIFLKGKYDYQQTIKRISRLITSVLDVEGISKQITHTVSQSMKIDNVNIFLFHPLDNEFKNLSNKTSSSYAVPLVFEPTSFIAETLRKSLKPIYRSRVINKGNTPNSEGLISELGALKAEIIIPMIYKGDLNGFLSLGEKHSGDVFTSEDVDLLETLAGQTSLAFENAVAYGKIAELNKNLEKKVDLRTKALKEALYEKERTQEQLIRSESLAAIGQLVAGTAHELNNPLATVSSLLQSSIEDLKTPGNDDSSLDAEFIADLEFAEKELKRAKHIVESLLGLSRQTQTYSEMVNVNELVQDALRILYSQYKHDDLDIAGNFKEDIPEVRGNFSNLGQVVLNIIQNAIQAVRGTKGKISIATHFEKKGHRAVIECKDSGPGVPLALRQDIFKPFFTTKPVGEGTGLGLYICHEIVEKHGGTLTLEDNNGKGAKFVVSLPVN